jgi:hypothetical protein
MMMMMMMMMINNKIYQPVPVAARSEAHTVLDSPDIEIVGSNSVLCRPV